MLAVIAGALAARRGQALAVFLLAVLATAGAAAAPMYAAAAGRAIASNEFAAAEPTERRLRLVSMIPFGGLPADPSSLDFAGHVRDLTPPGFDVVLATQAGGQAVGPGGEVRTAVVFRQGVCERVAVTGSCPTTAPPAPPFPVMMSANTAAELDVGVGDPITFQSIPMRVVGVYRPLDPADPYWLGGEYLRPAPPGRPSTSAVGSPEDALFVSGALSDLDGEALTYQPVADLYVSEHLLRTRPAGELAAEVTSVAEAAGHRGLAAGSELAALLDRIALDRRQLDDGVALGAALLVLLCWLVLFVAVGSAVDERRPEQGLLLLRGIRRRRLWALAAGEHAVPVLAAVPVGCLAGLGAVGLLARYALGEEPAVGLDRTAIGYGLVAAAGALAAVLLAQARTMSAPVVDLLRRVPARTRGWRAGAGDVVVLSVAVAAVVQLRTGGTPSGLALLAPVAVALAGGVLVARLAMAAGAAIGAALLRRGRVGVGLGLVQFARQPRLRPLIALLTVVLGMLAFTAGVRGVARDAYADRAAVEVGADRVVGVEALSRRHLLDAVRATDPEGRFAMAAVQSAPQRAGMPVLAVSADRLAAVVPPHPAYGGTMADLAATLRPKPLADPVAVRAPAVTVAVTTSYDPRFFPLEQQPRLYVVVASRSGIRQVPTPERLKPGRAEHRLLIPECVPDCRLVGLEVDAPFVRDEAQVRITELRHGDDDAVLLTADQLADPRRWRFNARAAQTVEPSSEPGLLLGRMFGYWPETIQLSVADAPDPLPVWATGSIGKRDGEAVEYDGVDAQPARGQVVGVLRHVPRLGGRGLVVDLEYADRLARAGRSGQEEVWLGRAAPADVLDRLRAQGLAVRYDRTATGVRQELTRQGPALALDFNLFAALAGVLIGVAGLVAVATGEQRDRVATFVALRRQGLPARAVRGGHGWSVAVGALAGVLVALAIWLFTWHGQRLFTDGRSPVPVPDRPDPAVLALVGLPAVAVLVAAAVLLSGALAAAVRRRSRS
ncbi:hypothetical protein K7640_14380 [Micromonospora sp. PLK6-60]|uniref:FtsX-like permease family protein n=1 Tax=Micromonospora sp. PLK6-60 TaxID=2873383 RepID=UPI001CA68CBE|nr:FtsX-like permease family protein [Micromonospora sp. PLK6-60]MBY8873019.1 hypothetical protein [Micromonospora sp. PLK6-60]